MINNKEQNKLDPLNKEREPQLLLLQDKLKAITIDFNNFYEVAEHVGRRIARAFNMTETPSKGYFKTSIGLIETAGIARLAYKWLETDQFELSKPETGEFIAHYFLIKESSENKGLFETPEGLKSHQELAAMTATVIVEAMSSLPKKYLVKSESEQGFWSVDQGWVPGAEQATKFDAIEVDKPVLLTGASDASSLLANLARDFDAPNRPQFS